MRISVLGAGPIGLEAAAAAQRDGHEVVIWEAGGVAASLRRWAHVQMFTSWQMNTTELGRQTVGSEGLDSEERPTGAEFLWNYLEPLAETLDVRTGHRIQAIGRTRLRKQDSMGATSRQREDFRLLIDGPDGQFHAKADAVLDCGGVFDNPLPAGVGGVHAPGEVEAAASGRLVYGPVPVQDLAGSRVVLIGDGTSALSVLRDLLALRPAPRITWLTLNAAVPGFRASEDDGLPERHQLYLFAQNALDYDAVRHQPDVQVERFRILEDGSVGLALTDGSDLKADRVLACTGYRPDHTAARELQLHRCWGTDAPMALSTALLAQRSTSCLDAHVPGADLLRSPEPNYFVLGHKSYGRRSSFLLGAGHQQIADVLTLLWVGTPAPAPPRIM